jgi:hypothetical protein
MNVFFAGEEDITPCFSDGGEKRYGLSCIRKTCRPSAGLSDSQAVGKRILLVNIARMDSSGNGIYERQDFHKIGPGPWKCGN